MWTATLHSSPGARPIRITAAAAAAATSAELRQAIQKAQKHTVNKQTLLKCATVVTDKTPCIVL